MLQYHLVVMVVLEYLLLYLVQQLSTQVAEVVEQTQVLQVLVLVVQVAVVMELELQPLQRLVQQTLAVEVEVAVMEPQIKLEAAGGSGIVIISYPGSTPQMAGGTVTVSGGNVIHTFTSSGYLSPIVNLNNSLRFRNTITGSPSNPAYLSRTFPTAGNLQKWTFSVWIKKTLGRQTVFGRGSSQFGAMQFDSTDTLSLNWASGGTTYNATTTQVFRDPSAWYHLVWAIDTTQSVSTARQRLYVNGSEVTAWSAYTTIPQNTSGNINTANSHWIGRFGNQLLSFRLVVT